MVRYILEVLALCSRDCLNYCQRPAEKSWEFCLESFSLFSVTQTTQGYHPPLYEECGGPTFAHLLDRIELNAKRL